MLCDERTEDGGQEGRGRWRQRLHAGSACQSATAVGRSLKGFGDKRENLALKLKCSSELNMVLIKRSSRTHWAVHAEISAGGAVAAAPWCEPRESPSGRITNDSKMPTLHSINISLKSIMSLLNEIKAKHSKTAFPLCPPA